MLRIITDSCVKKYEPLITLIISSIVLKNWKDRTVFAHPDCMEIGKTGHTVDDLRQEFRIEAFRALSRFSGNKGKYKEEIKEATFVYTYMKKRALKFVKKYTKEKFGYGKTYYSFNDISILGGIDAFLEKNKTS